MPSFQPDVLEYMAETSDATNTITATPLRKGAAVEISHGEKTVANGTAVTWEEGENTLTITVHYGNSTRVYTVVVTHTAA